MSDRERFKIRFDEEGPEAETLREDVENLHIDKLRRRINRVAFLVPVLIGAVLAFGYLDIRNRFDKNIGSGSSNVQTLSKSLASNFSSLSIRQAKLESLLEEKLSEIEKTTVSLKIQLAKAQNVLSKNINSTQSGAKQLQNKIADIDQSLAPLNKAIASVQQQFEQISAEIKTVKKELAAGLSRLDKDVQQARSGFKDLQELKTDISKIDSAKLDKKMFELAIRHEEKLYQKKLEVLSTSLSSQLDAINKQIAAIERAQQKISASSPSVATPPLKAPASPQPTTGKANAETGGILEKNLN